MMIYAFATDIPRLCWKRGCEVSVVIYFSPDSSHSHRRLFEDNCYYLSVASVVLSAAFSALTLLVGRQEEHAACKN